MYAYALITKMLWKMFMFFGKLHL